MPENEDETLAESFWAVAGRLRHLTLDSVAPWGVTPAQARALGVLGRHGEMRLSELSEHLRIAPRSATEVVDALQERALVVRRPDRQDRRAVLVTLTGEGERVGMQVRSARSSGADALFGTLADDDRETLRRILRSLRHQEIP